MAALIAGAPFVADAAQAKKAGDRKRLQLNGKAPLCPDCKDQGEIKCNCGPSRRRGCMVCRGSGRMQGEAGESVGVGSFQRPVERSVAITKRCTACDGTGKTTCRFCTEGIRPCRRCFGVSPAARAEHDLLSDRRDFLVWKEGTFTKGALRLSYEGPPVGCIHVLEAVGTQIQLTATTTRLDKKRQVPSRLEKGRRVVLVSTAAGEPTDFDLSGAVGSTFELRITPIGFDAAFNHAMKAKSYAAAGLFFAACSQDLDEKSFDGFLQSNIRTRRRTPSHEVQSLPILLSQLEEHQPQFRSLADFGVVVEKALGDSREASEVRKAVEEIGNNGINGGKLASLINHEHWIAFFGTMVHIVDRVRAAPMKAPNFPIKNECLGIR
jgi:hypothetical protein